MTLQIHSWVAADHGLVSGDRCCDELAGCFNCGEVGHKAADCPQPRKQGGGGAGGRRPPGVSAGQTAAPPAADSHIEYKARGPLPRM